MADYIARPGVRLDVTYARHSVCVYSRAMDRMSDDHEDPRWRFLGGSLWNIILNIAATVFAAALLARLQWLASPTNNTLALLGAGFLIITMVLANIASASKRRASAAAHSRRVSVAAETTPPLAARLRVQAVSIAPPDAATTSPVALPAQGTPSVEVAGSTALQATRAFVREQTAAEILKVIRDTVPLMQQTVWEGQYKGRWARWSGKVTIISDHRRTFGVVTLHAKQGNAPHSFTVDIPQSDSTSVETVRVGDDVTVEGQLDTFSRDSFVSLRHCRILEHVTPAAPATEAEE